MNSKLMIFSVLFLSVMAFFIIPRTRFGRRLKLNERLFYVINIIGLLCGLAGLALALRMGERVMTGHYFELVLLPAVLVYLYSAVVMKSAKGGEPFDEKQNLDMTRAAALSMPLSIAAMFLVFGMYREGVFQGIVWFPVYMFLTLSFYSAGVLYYFRKH